MLSRIVATSLLWLKHFGIITFEMFVKKWLKNSITLIKGVKMQSFSVFDFNPLFKTKDRNQFVVANLTTRGKVAW